MRNLQVIVIGYGRCGTSMVAGVLDKLGVEMMRGELNEPIKESNNVYGYFQHGDFHKMFEGSKKQFDKELSKYKDKKGLWGWKEPRSIEHMSEIFKYMSNPHFVWCKRNTDNQIQSMRYHVFGNKLHYLQVAQFLDDYNDQVEKEILNRDLKLISVKFERMLKNPTVEIQRLAEFIDLKINNDAIDLIDDTLPLFYKKT